MQVIVLPKAAWDKYTWSVVSREFNSGAPFATVIKEWGPLQELQRLAKYGEDKTIPEPEISDILEVPKNYHET